MKLSGACCAVRSTLHVSNTDTLKSIYFACFRSIMKYGVISWRNWSDSKKIFTLQKKTLGIMGSIKPRNLCRGLFKGLEIICLPHIYIFALMNLSLNNQKHFQINPAVHTVNTQYKHYLHSPIHSPSCFQKSAHYIGIKIFHSLPFSPKVFWLKRQYSK
jgi:hypothetical protein